MCETSRYPIALVVSEKYYFTRKMDLEILDLQTVCRYVMMNGWKVLVYIVQLYTIVQ